MPTSWLRLLFTFDGQLVKAVKSNKAGTKAIKHKSATTFMKGKTKSHIKRLEKMRAIKCRMFVQKKNEGGGKSK